MTDVRNEEHGCPRPDSSRLTACLAVSGVMLASLLTVRVVSGSAGYALGTLALAAGTVALIRCWPRGQLPVQEPRVAWLATSAALLAGLALMVLAGALVIPVIFSGPPDPYRGDMLVSISLAAARFASGQNPYIVYYLPWKTPLAYGPGLWLPHVASHVFQFDPRVLTLVGQLLVVGLCVIAGVLLVRRGFRAAGALFGLLALAFGLHPEVTAFFPIGHTQVYWPWIVLVSLVLRLDRMRLAGAALGLLVLSRSTMITLVPLLGSYVYLRRRGELLGASLAFGIVVAVGFGPFLLWDAEAVWTGMYRDYIERVKGFVWASTTGALETYGVTAWLVGHDLHEWVQPVQVMALGLVYAAAWRGLRRGDPVEPWMAATLLVFSATALWPVIYIYFDVLVLILAALAVHAIAVERRPPGVVVVGAGALVAAAVIAVLGAGALRRGSSYVIDVGSPASLALTGGGFGADVAVFEGSRSAVVVEGPTATVRLPRAGFGAGRIRVVARTQIPAERRPQRIRATLNDQTLGVALVPREWEEMVFEAPSRVWRYGFNVLRLHMSQTAIAPDGREVSIAVDRITLE